MKHGHSGYTHGGCRCNVCLAAIRAYNRGRRLAGKTKEYQRKYHAANRERAVAISREYHDRHREATRVQERSPEAKRRKRERFSARRARLRGQFVENVNPAVVWQMHGGRCGICGAYVPPDDFHVDHVVPLSRGGMHGYVNCQPAHPFCNLSKGAR